MSQFGFVSRQLLGILHSALVYIANRGHRHWHSHRHTAHTNEPNVFEWLNSENQNQNQIQQLKTIHFFKQQQQKNSL